MMAEPARSSAPAQLHPTLQQRTASDPRSSVWVNASAGSGKTTVLTKRVVRLLLNGVLPQRLLCLTFTRAAAAEMALRVTRQLSEWATCSDHALSESLFDLQGCAPTADQMDMARRLFAKVLTCPGGMRIRTIHSFGQEILRRFPIEAGLPPHFSVIEEADAEELQQEVLMELLEGSQGKDLSTAIKLLVCDLGEKGFMEAMQAILRARAKVASVTDAAGGLGHVIEQIYETLALAPGEDEKSVLREAFHEKAFPEADMRQLTQMYKKGTPSFAGRGAHLQMWLDLDADARLDQFDIYCGCFLKKDKTPFTKYGDNALLKIHPELDTLARREAGRLMNICAKIEAAEIAALTSAVLQTGKALSDRYDLRKRERALLDYDDLIIETNALISRSGIAKWVLFKLDGGLDHILVDEAQDTSRAQWNIVRILADEFFAGRTARDDVNRTLFVVGDEKQSIFSFQSADPEAFTEMRSFFESRILESGKNFTPVSLSVSFRSSPVILKAVDIVFADPDVQRGVSLTPVSHKAFRNDKPGKVEVWPLIAAPQKDEAKESWELPLGYEPEHDPQAELATRIAAHIESWFKNNIRLPGEENPIAPSDIMILLRQRGRFADLLVRALKQRSLPVTGVDRMHLIRQLPVMDLVALIQFVLLPEDDLNLASVLRGPMLNVSEDTLMQLCIKRDGTLWRNVNARGPAEVIDYLTRLRGFADICTPFSMLTHILCAPCPGSAVSGRQAIWARLGPDALDPIEELLNAAQNFSRRHAPSLQSFLHWLTVSDVEIKRELDSGTGQIRIMTVHASKGLEAPVVILPDTTGVPKSSSVPKLLWADGTVPVYFARRPRHDPASYVWGEGRSKQLEEYRRLLYVALTRAARHLIVAGWEQKREEKVEASWYNLIHRALLPFHEPAVAGDDDILALGDPVLHSVKPEPHRSPSSVDRPSLPAWAVTAAPAEAAGYRNVAPSRLAMQAVPVATPDVAFGRGRIIHRLLQSLPEVAAPSRSQAALRFLRNPQFRLTPAQCEEIHDEVMGLMNDPSFGAVFGEGSQAEVPLVGVIGGKKISGQIDRLCLQGNEVWIVDFKTNRPPPLNARDAPAAYRSQLASYRDVIGAVYPQKAIRCFLLWTYSPRLMEISPELLLS